MSASAIVWFEDFQLTQNAEGTHPDRFQIGHRYTSLVGLATRAGSSVLNGVNGCSQPNHDIHTRCGKGTAASAKGFPKADLQVCSVDPGDAASGFKVSEAQEVGFAKFHTKRRQL
jgi:hypothetical protein